MSITQKQKIMNYMEKFKSITSWEAYMHLGITQLATRVKELKEDGYQCKTKWEKQKNKEGKWIQYKRYYLWK